MNSLINNAFRILGLPVTATKRETFRRVEEIQPFITIGQTPHYDTDLPWLGRLQRNEQTVKKALQELENPSTKLAHVLSWFWVINEHDNLAMEALNNEDIDKAVSIWYAAAQQENGHYKKNLATLEYISAFRETGAAVQHLNTCFNYWAELITSGQLLDLIANLDPKLLNKFTDTEIVKFIGKHLTKTAMPHLKMWVNGNQIYETGLFFATLNESELPTKIIASIKEEYATLLSEKIDKISTEFSDVGDDYENIYTETKAFHKNVNPYLEQIKQTGDTFLIETYGDKIGEIILDKAIDYGNNTKQWTKSKELCELAQTVIVGVLLKDRLEKNISVISSNASQEEVWKDLKPIEEAPGLGTINGIGTTLYGHSNYDPESGSYETTRYFVILGIPILPLGRYRVINAGDNYYRFLGKVPFRSFDKWHFGVAVLAIFICGIFIANSGTNSKNYTSRTYRQPTPTTYDTNSRLREISSLRKKIDDSEPNLNKMASELLSMENVLESYSARLKVLKGKIEDTERKMRRGLYINEVAYKNNIDDYNNLLRKGKAVFADHETKRKEYNNLVNIQNENIKRYNQLR